MSIPLDKSGPADPGWGQKGKKRTRGYQNPDELKNFKDIMMDIDMQIGNAYKIAYDTLKEQDSSCIILIKRKS